MYTCKVIKPFHGREVGSTFESEKEINNEYVETVGKTQDRTMEVATPPKRRGRKPKAETESTEEGEE